MTLLDVRQHSDEWYALRSWTVGGSDMPIILGLSPYGKAEGQLAREKLGEAPPEVDDRQQRRMRLGLALEPIVRDEDVRKHGIKARKVNRTHAHPDYPWAIASLDFVRVGEKAILETKTTHAHRWTPDEPPLDVQAQVQWQMGVADYPRAHVACLQSGELLCYDLDFDAETFATMLKAGRHFLDRLAAGGPFNEDSASIRSVYPVDDGSQLEADDELTEAVHALFALRDRKADLDRDEDRIETAIKQRMGLASLLVGPDFRVSWKRTRGRRDVDWKVLAEGFLKNLPEPDRETLIGLYTTVHKEGRQFRPVRKEAT